MIELTEEELAHLISETFRVAAILGAANGQVWVATEHFHDTREKTVQRLLGVFRDGSAEEGGK